MVKRALAPLSCVLLLLSSTIALQAQVPDLTDSADPNYPSATVLDKEDINLGPTGMKGWVYHESVDSSLSRQILVTSVDAGSPADGILAVDDVILGADGSGANPGNFNSDARRSFAQAIQDAEASSPATLKLLRWRAGVTQTVELTLQTLGAYSATAPYNCSKSATILEQGLQEVMANQDAGRFSMNALTLLAANDPGNPANAARQSRAQSEALALMLTQEEIDARLSGFVSTDSKVAWTRGHELIVLAEYYLQTGDSQVLPSIEAMAVEICNGQSLLGTMGHQFTNPIWNEGLHGPYNVGYGAVNSAGLPCYFGLLLARKCGVTRPELAPAIDRASNFFAAYAGYGTIPYGEHKPYRNLHESNGKAGLAALVFSIEGSHAEAADYYTKLATAAASEREIGHTGAYFNYLWAPLGANVGGQEAAASYFSRISWLLDLNRRWDGGFDYDCWYEGRDTGGPTWQTDFWMNTPALLTYAMPLQELTITGKNQDPALHLSGSEIAEATFADTYDATTRTTPEIVADLGHWSHKIHKLAADELGARTADHATLVPQLIAIANDVNAGHQRLGACFALGKIGDGSAAADLAALLTDSDERVRWASARALRDLPVADVLTHLDTILQATASTARPFDPLNDSTPLQFAHGELCFLLFNNGGSNGPLGIIRGNLIDGMERTLLYPAIEAVANTPMGSPRSTLQETFKSLTEPDMEALAGTIVDTVAVRSPADKMFGHGCRVGALEILQAFNVAEGVPLAVRLAYDEEYSQKPHALEMLANYAGSSNLVKPGVDVAKLCEYISFAKPLIVDQYDPQLVLDAIAADANPVAPTPLKQIQSVTAAQPTLQLPATTTAIDVEAYDHAHGDTVYTWRKLHGAGEVTFAHNGTADGKHTAVVINGIPGQYHFEVTMSDSRGLTIESATVAVTLLDSNGNLPPNSPPDATPQTLPVARSTATPVVLSGTDPEGYPLNFAVTGQPSHGTLSGTAPHLTYTPTYDYVGADAFTFEVTDSEGQSDTATISLDVAATSTLEVAVYEPFDYPAGLLNGRSGSAEVGLDGVWAAHPSSATVSDGSLTWGDLSTTGGKFEVLDPANNWGGTRSISASALANNGLLDDGATMWFSAQVGFDITSNYTSGGLALALANNGFNTGNNRAWIEDDGATPGSGIGIFMGKIGASNGRIQTTQYLDQSQADPFRAMVHGSWDSRGAELALGEHCLIVGRITWAADPLEPDLIQIYQPLAGDLALPDHPISELSVVLDQASFDTLTFVRFYMVALDEIRFGSNYQSVLAGTEPMTPDTTAPGPVGFEQAPSAIGDTIVTMEATPAFDPNGVEYYFTCTSGGGNDSGWQSSPSYSDSGLTPGVTYSYTVSTRDLSPARNVSAPSAAETVTLPTSLTIPDVVGLGETAARGVIEAFHFTVGTVTTTFDAAVPVGAVISQSPTAGGSATGGTVVDLVVSLGPPDANNAPVFLSDPIVGSNATQDVAYTGTLDGSAVDDDGDNLEYAKVSGPAWLSVALDGTLSGTPVGTDLGLNSFTVSVTDGIIATPVEATLNITVVEPDTTVLLGGFHGLNETALQSPTLSGISVTLARTGTSTDITQGYSQINSDTWGNTLPDVPAPTIGNGDDLRNGIVQSGTTTPFTLVLTVTNNGTDDLLLEQIHYNIKKDVNNEGPNAGTLTYTAGDLADSTGANAAFAIPNGVTGNDITLSTFLSDTTLAAGESATFTWAHGAPEDPGGNTSLRMDNFAISGSVVPAPPNNAPTWTTDPVNESDATEDGAYTSTLADDASDADSGDTLTFAKLSGPAWLTVAADGTLSGTPTNADVGANSFTVSVTDNVIAAPVEATLDITVVNTNDAPAFTTDPISGSDASEDTLYSATIAGSATDEDAGAILQYAKVRGPAWLSVALDGTLSGTPSNSDVGTNVFTVSVTDNIIGTPVEATLNITVLNTNDAPVFTLDPITGSDATQDLAYTGTLDGSAVDDDGDNLEYAKVSGPAWLTVATDGTLSGTPSSTDIGLNTFTVSVTDSIIGTPVEATLNITVIEPDTTVLLGGFHGLNETALQSPTLGGVSVTLARTGSSTDITQGYSQINSDTWGNTTLDVAAPTIGDGDDLRNAIIQSGTTTPFTLVLTVTNNGTDHLLLEQIHYDIKKDVNNEGPNAGTLTYTAGDLADSTGANAAFAIPNGVTGNDITLSTFLSDTTLAAGESATFTWAHGAPEDSGGNTSLRLDNFAVSGSVVPAPPNNAPIWTTDSITGADADEGVAYSGSLSGMATDDDGDSLDFAKVSGPAWLTVATDGTLSGTPGSGDVGPNSFTVSVTDNIATADTAILNIEVLPAPSTSKLFRTTLSAVGNDSWMTVDLGQSYDSAVIVATAVLPSNTHPPVVTRLRNVSGNSFDIRIERLDGQTGTLAVDVHIIAVEEGVYTLANDGVTMEAVKYTSTITANKTSWVAESQSYQNSYTNPVVVGQVMSANDTDWSVFWSMGSGRTSPPDASNLNTGKHIGEDPNGMRADETVGYIVIESGTGALNGINLLAGLGADSVQGPDNSTTGYSYSLSGLSSASSAAASLAGMDGPDGGFAVMTGASPLSTTSITFYADEDALGDSERAHTAEQVGYLILE